MKIAILDDYQNMVKTLTCFNIVNGHDVTIWNDHTKDTDLLVERLKDAEALILIRERTPIRADLIERLPKLRLSPVTEDRIASGVEAAKKILADVRQQPITH